MIIKALHVVKVWLAGVAPSRALASARSDGGSVYARPDPAF
ncbi:MAG: hypothetical protein ACM3X3_03795 [Betaproteobacteria bacterium]